MDWYLSIYLRIKIYEFLDENNNFIKKHCVFFQKILYKNKTPPNFFDGGSPCYKISELQISELFCVHTT